MCLSVLRAVHESDAETEAAKLIRGPGGRVT